MKANGLALASVNKILISSFDSDLLTKGIFLSGSNGCKQINTQTVYQTSVVVNNALS